MEQYPKLKELQNNIGGFHRAAFKKEINILSCGYYRFSQMILLLSHGYQEDASLICDELLLEGAILYGVRQGNQQQGYFDIAQDSRMTNVFDKEDLTHLKIKNYTLYYGLQL